MKTLESQKTVVMVVDDSIDSIRMISDALEEEGMTALVALEGNQALTISQNIVPDVVLMDAIMPNMDGFETCRRLKENPEFADTPIIFMTGLSDTEHVVMGLKSGGVDYVTKPIETRELMARMQVHLANARVTRSTRSALDSAGQSLFATDANGRALWSTPRAQQVIAENLTGQEGSSLDSELKEWLSRNPDQGHTLTLKNSQQALAVEFLALIDNREYLLRINQGKKDEQSTSVLKDRFQLTPRESDVLLWIANGKTNREIAQILEMSPRTVNKHLEQVFRKLGVENRTSAAAAAIKCLAGV